MRHQPPPPETRMLSSSSISFPLFGIISFAMVTSISLCSPVSIDLLKGRFVRQLMDRCLHNGPNFNEDFCREVLQGTGALRLYTEGLDRRRQDGSPQRDDASGMKLAVGNKVDFELENEDFDDDDDDDDDDEVDRYFYWDQREDHSYSIFLKEDAWRIDSEDEMMPLSSSLSSSLLGVENILLKKKRRENSQHCLGGCERDRKEEWMASWDDEENEDGFYRKETIERNFYNRESNGNVFFNKEINEDDLYNKETNEVDDTAEWLGESNAPEIDEGTKNNINRREERNSADKGNRGSGKEKGGRDEKDHGNGMDLTEFRHPDKVEKESQITDRYSLQHSITNREEDGAEKDLGGEGETCTENKEFKGDCKEYAENKKSEAEEKKFTGRNDKISGNTQPLTGNTQPLTGNTQLLTGNTQPLTGNTQLLTGNTQPLTGNTQLLTGNTQPLTGNTQPLTGNTHPLTGNTQPLTGYTQPLNSHGMMESWIPLSVTESWHPVTKVSVIFLTMGLSSSLVVQVLHIF